MSFKRIFWTSLDSNLHLKKYSTKCNINSISECVIVQKMLVAVGVCPNRVIKELITPLTEDNSTDRNFHVEKLLVYSLWLEGRGSSFQLSSFYPSDTSLLDVQKLLLSYE